MSEAVATPRNALTAETFMAAYGPARRVFLGWQEILNADFNRGAIGFLKVWASLRWLVSLRNALPSSQREPFDELAASLAAPSMREVFIPYLRARGQEAVERWQQDKSTSAMQKMHVELVRIRAALAQPVVPVMDDEGKIVAARRDEPYWADQFISNNLNPQENAIQVLPGDRYAVRIWNIAVIHDLQTGELLQQRLPK